MFNVDVNTMFDNHKLHIQIECAQTHIHVECAQTEHRLNLGPNFPVYTNMTCIKLQFAHNFVLIHI